MPIPHCPRLLVDETMADLLELADLAEQRNLPVAGGVGDQTQSFLDAWRCLRIHRRRLEAEELEAKQAEARKRGA